MRTALFRRAALVAAGVAVWGGGAGCVSYRHDAFAESLRAADPTPPLVRQRVYLFAMTGDDFGLGGLSELRDELCRAGYPKVYTAQKEDCPWYFREMRRLRRDEPDARMVLLGYGTAAGNVLGLARDAVRDKLPLDAVVLVDPVGVDGPAFVDLGVVTVAVRSHNWGGSPGLAVTETVTLPGGHAGAAKDPATVAAVATVMRYSAVRVVPPSTDDLPALPLRDKPEATPRGTDPATLNAPVPAGYEFFRPAPRQLEHRAYTPPPAPPKPPAPPPAEALPKPREVPK